MYLKISTKALLILVIVLFSANLYAQDLIVTNEGDSLNCKITSVKSDRIYFTFKHKNEVRNTLLFLNKVRYHQVNYYSNTEVPVSKIPVGTGYPNFRLAINAGLAYRTAKIADNVPSDFKSYMKDLKSGVSYSADISYFFSEQLGFGLKYALFKSKNSVSNVMVTFPDGSSEIGSMSDNISNSFFGPIFTTRLLNGSKNNAFIMSLGLGYMGYTNKSTLASSNYTIKSSTMGLCWDIGYDVGLSKNMSLGFQLSMYLGTLTKYEISDGVTTRTVKLEEDSYESLSRIDLTIGLRFSK